MMTTATPRFTIKLQNIQLIRSHIYIYKLLSCSFDGHPPTLEHRLFRLNFIDMTLYTAIQNRNGIASVMFRVKTCRHN